MDRNINFDARKIKKLIDRDSADEDIILFNQEFIRAGKLVSNHQIDEAIKLLECSKEKLKNYPNIVKELKPLLEYLSRL
ncbi:hypothetical protein HMPREF2542_02165 [Streptococcus sp. HMSC034B05]|uniref:hypothetical protein n=1 Tax=Streptococcus sp. HMSC034B05 TaxID=1715022 RepID=UPI0008A42418|nr:hypothetical protein [Streptococcus sp. HMSC034B05]OFN56159.1 hypothetical protein HMPREF2542_02165 [Streptococcus sp. HMSC034B05]